jgi:hypothetical protein
MTLCAVVVLVQLLFDHSRDVALTDAHVLVLFPHCAQTLCNGKVRCPWHGACFNTSTGDIEDSPGLDSIHSFKVRSTAQLVGAAGSVPLGLCHARNVPRC